MNGQPDVFSTSTSCTMWVKWKKKLKITDGSVHQLMSSSIEIVNWNHQSIDLCTLTNLSTRTERWSSLMLDQNEVSVHLLCFEMLYPSHSVKGKCVYKNLVKLQVSMAGITCLYCNGDVLFFLSFFFLFGHVTYCAVFIVVGQVVHLIVLFWSSIVFILCYSCTRKKIF